MVLAKFEENLIKLSLGNTWEESSKEWGFLYKRDRPTKDNHCLCGYKLKHQYYYYNKNTKKIICAGMECKKHIDEHRGNRKYDIDFIRDVCYLGTESVGDYDLQSWCKGNEQTLWDKFFWRIDGLHTEDQLDKYFDYIKDYWCDLINVDCIIDKINHKLQIIFDREDEEEKKNKELNEYKKQLEEENKLKTDKILIMSKKKKIILYTSELEYNKKRQKFLEQEIERLT